MASSIVSGSSGVSSRRGYAIEPQDFRREPPKFAREEPINSEKPSMPSRLENDHNEDEKIDFSCANGTPFLKISSALLVSSFVLQIIAVGSPYWAAGWRRDKMSWHEGVWMTCYREETENKWICGSYDYFGSVKGIPGWYMLCQALALASLVVFLPTILLNFFYTMHPKEKFYTGLFWFNVILTAATALLPLVMLIAFAAGHPKKDRFPVPYEDKDYDDSPFEFHFSWALEIIAFLVSTGACVLEILDFTRQDYAKGNY